MAEQGLEPGPLTPKSVLSVSRVFSWDQTIPVCPKGLCLAPGYPFSLNGGPAGQ